MKQRLEDFEIEELIQLHKTLKKKKEADKIKCLVLWGKGWSWQNIKEALLVSEHYISDLLGKYNTGKIKKVLENNYGANHKYLTVKQETKLCHYLDDNFIPSSKFVVKYIEDDFGVTYTHDGLVIMLHRLGYSYKKPVIIPGKTPSEEVQKTFINDFYELFNNKKADESFYFWDGSGFVHNVKASYGWIRKGTSKIIESNTGRKKINVNGACEVSDFETVSIIQDGSQAVNQFSNLKLLKKIIRSHPEKRKFYLFLDNAPSNHALRFTGFVNKLNEYTSINVELKFLPTYSPNLNLIERLWKYSKKELLRDYYGSFSDFKKRIVNFFENDLEKKFHKERLRTFIGTKFHVITR